MTKKTIIVKAQTDKSRKPRRHCLECGMDITDRSKDVKFCCPACKAKYKQDYSYVKDAKPEVKKQVDYSALPYKTYSTNPIERFNQRYGSN